MRYLAILIMVSLAFAAPTKHAKPRVHKETAADRFVLLKDTFDMARKVMWPDLTDPALICGQLEIESGWKKYAVLKTQREYGFGLAAITVAYDKNGKERMNVFADIKRRYPAAYRDWTWENRFDARFQLMASLQMSKTNYVALSMFTPGEQRLKAMLSAYNGGLGSVLQDRRLCLSMESDKSRCNQWDNGVALRSYKSRKPLGPEYSRSAFQVNREYPVLIYQRKRNYVKFF